MHWLFSVSIHRRNQHHDQHAYQQDFPLEPCNSNAFATLLDHHT